MADPKVRLVVQADVEKAANKLRDLGEKISNLGSRISAAFTLPIVGAFALAVRSSEELQAALKPVQDAFAGVSRELGDALVPIIQELTPMLLDLARSLSDMVRWFSELDPSMKRFVFNMLAVVAAVGPAMMAVGQFINFIGTLQLVAAQLGITTLPALGAAVKTFAVTTYTALAPLLPLLAAVAGLIALINSEFGQRGITAGKQLIALMAGGGTILSGGSREDANRAVLETGQNLGLFNQPAPAGGMAGQTIIYNNYGVDANNPYLKQALQPYIRSEQRAGGTR